MIRQNETGAEYAEAVDVTDTPYTYTETETKIPEDGEPEDADALRPGSPTPRPPRRSCSGRRNNMSTYTERARALRPYIVKSAASLTDADASLTPELFTRLTGSGSLVKAGMRINWGGTIKRAAVDLWDTAENTPDAAPNLWEDIQYKQGYRLIPETITAALAFAKGERGWWKDELYESLLAANVWNPSVNPDGWKKITEEGT